MKHKLETRLQNLREEYRKGQERLGILETEVTVIQEAMLRISGAVQVLEELLAEAERAAAVPNGHAETTAET